MKRRVEKKGNNKNRRNNLSHGVGGYDTDCKLIKLREKKKYLDCPYRKSIKFGMSRCGNSIVVCNLLDYQSKQETMKVLQFFVNAIYWLWLFIVPTGILGFLAIWLYFKSSDNLVFSIIIGSIGTTLGVVFAEYIRKKYGLDNFFGRLIATPDIDGGNILDKQINNKQNSSKTDPVKTKK
jgi:uncharacterized membrane protein YeaQ/YmgE (transglycosylase-associated protein family)